MHFNSNLVKTHKDLPGHTSLLIHSTIGCNLNCLGCLNRDIVSNKHNSINELELLNKIRLNGFLFDAIILSGNEFLMSPLENIISFLNQLKQVFSGAIIINTNGAYPDKIIAINSLIDGFHIDFKIHPDFDIEKKEYILGITSISIERYERNMLRSIDFIIKKDKPLSRIRTVHYPVLDDYDISLLKEYIYILKQDYDSNVPYDINEFFELEMLKEA